MRIGKKITKNFLSLFASDLITKVFGAALTIYVARVLGVASFGQLTFAIAFVSYFNIIADLGLTNFGIREIAKDKTKTGIYITNILALRIIVSLILFFLLATILVFLPLDSRIKTITFLFGLGMIPTALDMTYVFQAHEKMEFMVITKFVSQIVYVLLGFIFIFIFKDILYLPVANLISLIAGSLVLYYFLRKRISFVWSKVSLNKLKSTLISAFPFLLAAIMIQVYLNSGYLMLQFFKGENAVGLYAAANKIVLLILGLSGFLTWALYPTLSNHYEKNKLMFAKLVKFSARAFGSAAIPVSIGGIILSSTIMLFLYGNSYNAAIPVFSILIIHPVFMYLNCVSGNALASSGHQSTSTQAVTIAALLNIVLNFLLIPRFGIIGVAIVSVITEIFEVVYLCTAQKRLLGIDITRIYFIKPLIASVPMALVLELMPSNLTVIIKIAVGGFIYLAAFFIIGGFRQYKL